MFLNFFFKLGEQWQVKVTSSRQDSQKLDLIFNLLYFLTRVLRWLEEMKKGLNGWN